MESELLLKPYSHSLSGVLFSDLCLPSETESRVRTLSFLPTKVRFISNQVINFEIHDNELLFRLCSDGFSLRG